MSLLLCKTYKEYFVLILQDDLVNQKYDHEESSIKPTLELTEITEAEAGEYVCAATNNEGSAYSDPIVIDVTCKTSYLLRRISHTKLKLSVAINVLGHVNIDTKTTSNSHTSYSCFNTKL